MNVDLTKINKGSSQKKISKRVINTDRGWNISHKNIPNYDKSYVVKLLNLPSLYLLCQLFYCLK